MIEEVPLLRPLPGPDMVAITVTSSGSSLNVSAKTVNRRAHPGGSVFPDQVHTIQNSCLCSFWRSNYQAKSEAGYHDCAPAQSGGGFNLELTLESPS